MSQYQDDIDTIKRIIEDADFPVLMDMIAIAASTLSDEVEADNELGAINGYTAKDLNGYAAGFLELNLKPARIPFIEQYNEEAGG